MSNQNSNHSPEQFPSLRAVHQRAIERAEALNVLLEKSRDRQDSLKKRLVQLEGQIEKVLKEIQTIKKRWRVR